MNTNVWAVDVRHLKGKIDHPTFMKKNQTSGGQTGFLGFATGSPIIHTAFDAKKWVKKYFLVFLNDRKLKKVVEITPFYGTLKGAVDF